MLKRHHFAPRPQHRHPTAHARTILPPRRRRRQPTPRQRGNHLACRAAPALRQFLGRLQHIILNVQRRSHASDVIASLHQSQPRRKIGRLGRKQIRWTGCSSRGAMHGMALQQNICRNLFCERERCHFKSVDVQRHKFGLNGFLVPASQDKEHRNRMTSAELEDHLVALFHLPRGHPQRAQRVIDMRVGTCLIKQQVRSPLQNLGKGLFQGGFINPKMSVTASKVKQRERSVPWQSKREPWIVHCERFGRRRVNSSVPLPPCSSQSRTQMDFCGYFCATNARPLKVQ